jgi:hypothetical protein
VTTAPGEASGLPLTPGDETFSHQLVAPALATAYVDTKWGDRCYHQLHFDDLTVCAGRQLYPHDGRRFAFLGVATPTQMYCLRETEAFAPGDDPDQAQIGAVSIEVVKPLEEIRLRVEDPDFPVQMDLTYRGRFVPVATDRHRIEVRGEVVTDYMNFFQSGLYSGTIAVEGREYALSDHAGFRDRGWGLRKHEASGRRGFMVSVFCELAGRSIYAILFETASGKRAFTNGWLLDESGLRDTATAIDHDIELDGTLVTGGRVVITWASGERDEVSFRNVARAYIAGIGYSQEPELMAAGRNVFDLTDPAVVGRLNGQNDQGCVFDVGGETGHGYVETGVGIHPRYRPE